MNLRLLSKLMGTLLLLLGGAMFICLGVAYLMDVRREGFDSIESFWISSILTSSTGVLLIYLGRGEKSELLRKEAIAVVGLSWLVCGAFGALPYIFSEARLTPSEAFFESVSGFTTTGSSVFSDVEGLPRSVLFWRSLTQWLGGLGILVLFVALLTYLGVGSKALFRHESSAKSGEGVQARIRDVAARLWQIYVGLSAICCIGLMVLEMSFFDAINHTFAAISTGGFSTRNASIAAFNSLAIELWISVFMIMGGISFMLYAWLLRGKWERWKKEEETQAFLIIIAISTMMIALDLWVLDYDHSFGHALRNSFFQVVTIITTTGFATADFDHWPHFSRLTLIFLMCIGGCAGSTSGGIKVSRWLLFFKIVRQETILAFRPNQVIRLSLNGNPTDEMIRSQTVFFVALAGVTVALGTGLISLLEPGQNIETCFSSVMATLFNIGPGLSAVGPTQNFSFFSPLSQIVLSILMILGRLEFFAILVLFVPSLWKRY